MKIYIYVAIIFIAFLTRSCQCNNAATEEPEPEPTTPSHPANPQDGDHTPSAGHGPGKHRGIQRRSDWNTCYMNSTLQVLFALYGDLVKAHCAGATDGIMAAHMLKLFNKVTKADTSVITDQEIKDFYASMKAEKAAGGINWQEDFENQADSSELFTAFLEWLNVPSIEVREGISFKEEIILKLNFEAGSTSMQALIDNKELKKVPGLYNDILSIEIGRKSYTAGAIDPATGKALPATYTKNTNDILDPINITIKTTNSDLPADKAYQLVSFIHHGGGHDGGHYITYIKEGAKWICYNDSNVLEVSDAAAEVEAKKAYVFFYQPK